MNSESFRPKVTNDDMLKSQEITEKFRKFRQAMSGRRRPNQSESPNVCHLHQYSDENMMLQNLYQEMSSYVNIYKKYTDHEKAVQMIVLGLNEDSQVLREANAQELNEIKEQINRNDKKLAKIKIELDKMQLELVIKGGRNCLLP